VFLCSVQFADVIVNAAILEAITRLALNAAALGVHQQGNNETVQTYETVSVIFSGTKHREGGTYPRLRRK
jgi:hypothetical protein